MAKVSLRAYNRDVETMIDRGQLDEAIAHCRHILKTYPKHLETYRLLGKAYLEYKRYADAVDIFSRVLVSVPDDFVSHVGMSIIRDEESKLDDAIWHMERAFETQPSNPAIQSELQRLYGRRDGVQPPRIRMTRGALAHMYVQGELYPQAISEIKSVLKDDPGRSDMQALLARACYRSGLKNEAADVASALLRRYPYALDGNRVLVEILGAERPENAAVYRHRVMELDPYAAQVTGTVFQSNEVPDAAVTVERLDWNGQPVSMQPDWGETQAINLEAGAPASEQADWFTTPPVAAQPSMPPPAQPAEEIPDFLRAAGWGQSTGAFDESKPVFGAEEPAGAQPIEQGDLPDWVKAMRPAEAEPEAREPEEPLPDWINNIDKGILSSTSEQPDWTKQTEAPATPAATDQPDWLSQLGQPPATPAAEEQPDWLKGLGSEPGATASTPQAEQPDWLRGLGSESDFTPQPAQTETPDWLKGLESEPEPTSGEAAEQTDWLRQLDAAAQASDSAASTDFDFLNEPTEEPLLPSSSQSTPSAANLDSLGASEEERDDSFAWLESLAAKQGASEGFLTTPEERRDEEPEWVKQAKGSSTTQPHANLEDLGKSEEEQDDSFAWLESLAAKQGATEGLLTKPEDRLEEEPEWVKQAKGLSTQPPATQEAPTEPKQPAKTDEVEAWLRNLEGEKAAEPEPAADETAVWLRNLDAEATPTVQPTAEPSSSLQDFGKTEQQQDNSFAWLESLAAKQGATEGFLTTPEERSEEEPEWVKQAKEQSAQQPPMQSTTEPEPEQPAALDETAAWLKSLEAEEKSAEPAGVADETAMWLKSLDEKEKQPEAAEETDAWLKSLEQEEKPSEPAADQTAMWLKNLDEEQKQPEPEAAADDTAMWLKSLEEPGSASLEEAESTDMSMPAWMRHLEAETPERREEEEPRQPEETRAEETGILHESTVEESVPSWLADLDKDEEKKPTVSAEEDLPAWLRAEESSFEKPEPTHATDWRPAETGQPEIIYSPAPEEPKPPEIIYSPPLEETKQPQAEIPLPPVSFEERREEPVQREEQPAQRAPEAPKPEPIPLRRPPEKPAVTAEGPEPVRKSGLVLPSVDPVLGSARNDLSRSNIPAALDSYSRLIKKGRFLDEVIYDLREALYRYPVEVSLWQSLGDAYMRANRLQDALDAYTKAEELLR